MMQMPISYELMSPNAKPPVRQYPDDAGSDLFCTEDFMIRPGEMLPVGCGIGIYIPRGMFGLVTGKSGLSSRGLIIIPGIIDCSYTGEIKAIAHNTSRKMMMIGAGTAIAQLIILEMVIPYNFQVIQGNRKRGDNGFGSTAKEKEG